MPWEGLNALPVYWTTHIGTCGGNPLVEALLQITLNKVLHNSNTSSHLVNWSIELTWFDIEYIPKSKTKGQVIANFVVKFINFFERIQETPKGALWQVHLDGSACRNGGGVGTYYRHWWGGRDLLCGKIDVQGYQQLDQVWSAIDQASFSRIDWSKGSRGACWLLSSIELANRVLPSKRGKIKGVPMVGMGMTQSVLIL